MSNNIELMEQHELILEGLSLVSKNMVDLRDKTQEHFSITHRPQDYRLLKEVNKRLKLISTLSDQHAQIVKDLNWKEGL